MLINTTSSTQVVRIRLEDGTEDSINIGPMSRCEPPKGSTIDPRFHAHYAKTIKGVDTYKALDTTSK